MYIDVDCLSALMKSQKLTCRKLADKSGIEISTIYKILGSHEKKRSIASLTLSSIAAALGVPNHYLQTPELIDKPDLEALIRLGCASYARLHKAIDRLVQMTREHPDLKSPCIKSQLDVIDMIRRDCANIQKQINRLTR